jgi:HD superfamily phosphodiesterase
MQNQLIMEMNQYYRGDSARIQHFIKVYCFAKMIGELEKLGAEDQKILETAAIVHDIGIKLCEEKYGNCGGKLQEKEGPALAEQMLLKLGYEKQIIERVSYLVGHHHTYNRIDGLDYQILIEADFLVNLHEDGSAEETCRKVYDSIFKTEAGKEICRNMFGL